MSNVVVSIALTETPSAAATEHVPGTFCACPRCSAGRALALAKSRELSAVQAALWKPRSKRLRAAAAEAKRLAELAWAAWAARNA